MTTTLKEIAAVTDGVLYGSPDIEIKDVTHDSRHCGTGTLFVAIKGLKIDGNKFVRAVRHCQQSGSVREGRDSARGVEPDFEQAGTHLELRGPARYFGNTARQHLGDLAIFSHAA